MKHLLLTVSIITGLLLTTISCQKKNTSIVPKEITGKWNWTATYKNGPLSSTNPATPNNTGSLETFEFTSAMQWKQYNNNVFTDSGIYTLEHNSYANTSGTTLQYDQINFRKNGVLFKVESYQILNDTLSFDPSLKGIAGGEFKKFARQ